MLSRLPLPDKPTSVSMPGETILLLDMLNSLPVTATQIKRANDRDPILVSIRTMLQTGWKESTDEALKPLQQRQIELSVHDGCVLWGTVLFLLLCVRRSYKSYMKVTLGHRT